jgi:hypothetical protein
MDRDAAVDPRGAAHHLKAKKPDWVSRLRRDLRLAALSVTAAALPLAQGALRRIRLCRYSP